MPKDELDSDPEAAAMAGVDAQRVAGSPLLLACSAASPLPRSSCRFAAAVPEPARVSKYAPGNHPEVAAAASVVSQRVLSDPVLIRAHFLVGFVAMESGAQQLFKPFRHHRLSWFTM